MSGEGNGNNGMTPREEEEAIDYLEKYGNVVIGSKIALPGGPVMVTVWTVLCDCGALSAGNADKNDCGAWLRDHNLMFHPERQVLGFERAKGQQS